MKNSFLRFVLIAEKPWDRSPRTHLPHYCEEMNMVNGFKLLPASAF